jgi:CRP/FNR family transcriptional regulator, cyclic AMP receptor protein
MKRSVTGTLSLTDLFDNLTAAQLELVASICEPHVLRRGQILFHENEGSDDLYVIVRGAIDVLVNPGVITSEPDREPSILTTLQHGQVFGEVALVDQGLRSATVRASKDKTELLRIPRDRMMLLCDTYPELGYKIMRNLASDLALKIRNTDLTIRQYQLMNPVEPDPPAS